MVHNKFRSLINLDITAIKQIGQELLTSKPWSPPIGRNKTRYQGTPPIAAKKQNRLSKTPKAATIADFTSFINSL